MSSHMRAWLRLGGASGGGDSDEVEEVLPVARSPAALRLKADETGSNTWCSPMRMIASLEVFTGGVRTASAPPPLLCKDLRGLLNDCATNDVLDAYMALLQRCQIAQASERPPRIAFCPCSVSQLHRHSRAGRLARRLASFVPLAGRLFIPWHIPGGPGGGGHYIHAVASFSSHELSVHDPLRPDRTGTATGREAALITSFAALVAQASGAEAAPWSARWGHTGAQSRGSNDCGIHLMLAARLETKGSFKGHCIDGPSMRMHIAEEIDVGAIQLDSPIAGLLEIHLRPQRRRRGGARAAKRFRAAPLKRGRVPAAPAALPTHQEPQVQ